MRRIWRTSWTASCRMRFCAKALGWRGGFAPSPSSTRTIISGACWSFTEECCGRFRRSRSPCPRRRKARMKSLDELPVLFLLSRVLGGKTFTSHLQKVVQTIGRIRPHFVFLEEEDYGLYRDKIPLLNRMTGLYVGPSILKWKLRGTRLPPYRAVFVQSFEIMPACSALDPACPVILAHDATNILSYRLLRDVDPGPLAHLSCAFKSAVASPAYRAVLGRVRAFLPRTHWCGRSLTRDFGVDPDRIIVAPAG